MTVTGRRSRARPLGLALALLLVATAAIGGTLLWQPDWLLSALARRAPDVLYFVETAEPLVALTIDDGPDSATTPEILHVLAEHRARATFFLITSRVSGNEALVAEMVRQGHELGNHLTRDEPSWRLSPAAFQADLRAAHDVLSRFAPMRWVRPAGGWYDAEMRAVIRAGGYRCVLGSIYPFDAHVPWAGFIARQVLRRIRSGAIVVLHDGGDRGRRTAEALRRILPELARRGVRMTTVSDLTGAAARE